MFFLISMDFVGVDKVLAEKRSSLYTTQPMIIVRINGKVEKDL